MTLQIAQWCCNMGLVGLITGISLIFAGNSYHFDRPTNYNEENHIRGIELQVDDYEVGFKQFTNSFGDSSHALTLSKKKKFGNLGIGLGVGIVDNYEKSNFFIAPTISYEVKDFELDLSCSHRLCIYQLKYKFKW